ncbi:MFS transporter [Clostridium sp. 'deep sea']|uniref:MFS transporter n=1 Tax=Clostridium sp. 'deep sea' TaxID=2779445 RepID=UPI0018964E0B|nr:MFS transporter [Clostridium sp. 'deep sea']QOR37017.1 MFS transporter [Clostridium sp. 'deep sea']
MSFLRQKPVLQILTMGSVIINFTIAPVSMIAFPYVLRQNLQVGDNLYGIARSLMMTGPIIGSLLVSKFMKKYDFKKSIPALYCICGISFIFAGITVIPNMFPFGFWVAYIGVIISSFILGALITMASVISITARQKIIPGHMMGRISAVMSTFILSSIPLGQAIMGRMLDKIPAYFCILIFSVLVLMASLISRLLFKKMINQNNILQQTQFESVSS